MAMMTLMNGDTREVPDDTFRKTEHGVEWEEREETHLVPWTAILEVVSAAGDVLPRFIP